jgi:hypothetical protein
VIAVIAVAVTLTTGAGLAILVLVVAAVRREDADRLPVEARGPVTALARRVLGLHVRRTHDDIPDLRSGALPRATERK